MTTTTQTISSFHFLKNPWTPTTTQTILRPMNRTIRAAASVRSLNRKPLQKGRNLSIEAIQTIQALKLAYNNDKSLLDQVFRSKFSRLLKFDMTAVLRELLRQNHCLLALKVKYHNYQFYLQYNYILILFYLFYFRFLRIFERSTGTSQRCCCIMR